jgi:hypothetical protein
MPTKTNNLVYSADQTIYYTREDLVKLYLTYAIWCKKHHQARQIACVSDIDESNIATILNPEIQYQRPKRSQLIKTIRHIHKILNEYFPNTDDIDPTQACIEIQDELASYYPEKK